MPACHQATWLMLFVVPLISGCPTRAPQPLADDAAETRARPRVILFIGDGMGKVQEDVASRFATGESGNLAMHSLPSRGEILSASPSGLTDSAASATAMATGQLTYNGRIAIDRDGNEVATILEIAHGLGIATGLVTTTSLPHATPGSFGAHRPSRGQMREIAEDLVNRSKPEVMLGGGAAHFAPGDDRDDLVATLRAGGYKTIDSRDALAGVDGQTTRKLFGAFAPSDLPFVLAREGSAEIPSLDEMTAKAVEILDGNPAGFVLVVEGGRIDHAGHGNRLEDNIAETLEFDRTIAQTLAWAEGKEEVTILVTADHETGGLDVIENAPAGEYPEVKWRWGSHTNRRVNVYGRGDGLSLLDQSIRDHRAIFEVMEAAITGQPPAAPSRELLANGYAGELRYMAAAQGRATDFGARGQLDVLRLDADRRTVAVAIDGTFSFGAAAVVVFIDVDYGAQTGARSLTARPLTGEDPVDHLLEALSMSLAAPGFGAEFVAVSISGAESRITGPIKTAGWRELDEGGAPRPALARGAAINYDDGVRRDGPGIFTGPAPLSGIELGIPITNLFPNGVPAGARIAVIAVQTSADGTLRSNQALPSLPATDETVRAAAVLDLDGDNDGEIDPELTVSILPSP